MRLVGGSRYKSQWRQKFILLKKKGKNKKINGGYSKIVISLPRGKYAPFSPFFCIGVGQISYWFTAVCLVWLGLKL